MKEDYSEGSSVGGGVSVEAILKQNQGQVANLPLRQ